MVDVYGTGPGTLAGRYLRRFWHPALRSSDLDRGQALPVRILGQAFTLYRGESGAVHAVDSRCAHRRTQLSLGWIEGEAIRCFYHGWKYDGSGQCIEQPAESEAFAGKVRIAGYPAQEYLGLIFVYFGDDAPPPLPRHAEFEGDGTFEIETFTRSCNYFKHLELDPIHISFVHRNSPESEAGLTAVPVLESRETEYGYVIISRRTNPDGTWVDQVQHRLMPNISVFKVYPHSAAELEWRDRIAWRVPITDDRYISFVVDRIHDPAAAPVVDGQVYRPRGTAAEIAARDARTEELAAAVLAGRLPRDEAMRAAPNVVLLQDSLALIGSANAPLADDTETNPAVRVLHAIWSRELQALAAGGDLTAWHRSERLVATSGVSAPA